MKAPRFGHVKGGRLLFKSGSPKRRLDLGCAEAQLQREGVFVIQLDEAQHLFTEKKCDQIETILIGLKDLMKPTDRPANSFGSFWSTVFFDYLNRPDELVALMEPVSYVEVSSEKDSLNAADAVLCACAECAELDVSSLRNEDVFNWMIFKSARRWGGFIELAIQSMAQAKISGKTEPHNVDLADTFRGWTGASPRPRHIEKTKEAIRSGIPAVVVFWSAA